MFIANATVAKALAWLNKKKKKKKKRKDEQNNVLPGCWFATLTMLSGNIDVLVG